MSFYSSPIVLVGIGMEVIPVPPDNVDSSTSGQGLGDAIAELHRSHGDSLLRFVCRITGNQEDARDIVQETYLKMVEQNDPQSIKCPRAYGFKTSKNLAINKGLQSSRRRELDQKVPFEMNDRRSPENICIGRETLATISRALKELPANCQRAFVLVSFDGLRHDEAAEVMGISKRQVGRFVERALEYLSQAVAADESTPGGGT